ncbi:MAG: sigma-54 dependent transcriptional regulator [Cohaesibacter sp.]|nr:sigma-54 dependent transcriptional regulator [Cohaesibacter sp.]
MTASILIVEDTPSLATLYQVQLAKAGLSSTIVATGQEAIHAIHDRPYDVMLLDLQLPDMTGCDLLKALSQQGCALTTIMITAHGSINIATEAMRLGAYDFLMKPVSQERLLESIKNALEVNSVRATGTTETADTMANSVSDHQRKSTKTETKPFEGSGFVGSGPAMQAIYKMIPNIAKSKAFVFITGESGTGKEICAHAIHAESNRSDGPFIALNCAAIPSELIESELFGHKKGAFSGATSDRMGAVLSANGGTLFLDEICEMDVALQSKLLRFLQSSQVQRVGDDKVQCVDIRVICATNRIPLQEVAAGRFREDLYYRLHILAIALPALRERGEDILELADFFLKKACKQESRTKRTLDDSAKSWLLRHSWPGNVRQLENLIHSAIVIHDAPILSAALLQSLPLGQEGANHSGHAHQDDHALVPSSHEQGLSTTAPCLQIDLSKSYCEIEREILEAVITLHDGSLPKAAKSLDMSPSTLYRKRDTWQDQDLEHISEKCVRFSDKNMFRNKP